MSKPYKSTQTVWDSRSTVRRQQRRILSDGDITGYLFPPAIIPLCADERVLRHGEQFKRLLLQQCAYKYMSDVAHVETETINRVTLEIVNRRDGLDLPEDMRYDAYTIIIDEAYHAYVAADFVRQVSQRTGVAPIAAPLHSELTKAMERAKQSLPEQMHRNFDIVAICVGENTLTQEMLAITRDESICPYLDEVMSDHVRDEGRHCVLFSELLECVWAQLPEAQKLAIGALLPAFLLDYMRPDLNIAFFREILVALGMDAEEAAAAVADAYPPMSTVEIVAVNPILGHLIGILERRGVLAHPPTHAAFLEAGLIQQQAA